MPVLKFGAGLAHALSAAITLPPAAATPTGPPEELRPPNLEWCQLGHEGQGKLLVAWRQGHAAP